VSDQKTPTGGHAPDDSRRVVVGSEREVPAVPPVGPLPDLPADCYAPDSKPIPTLRHSAENDARCWRSECRDGCYYPDVCSERPRVIPPGKRADA